MDGQTLRNLQESYYTEVYSLDEAEGSYGQTPNARKAYGDLANKRRNTPASEFAKRGDKKVAVKSAQKHFDRTGNPDAGDRSKKSTKPDWNSGKRKGMTQSDRDHARGASEYGHAGYDPEGDGDPRGPGGKPKGKKLARQRATGVSAESFDLYDVVLSHLLDEGYADTQQAAEAIMVNMSEDWRESIVDEVLEEELTGARAERALDKGASLRLIHGTQGSVGSKGERKNLPTKQSSRSALSGGNKTRRRMGQPVSDRRNLPDEY